MLIAFHYSAVLSLYPLYRHCMPGKLLQNAACVRFLCPYTRNSPSKFPITCEAIRVFIASLNFLFSLIYYYYISLTPTTKSSQKVNDQKTGQITKTKNRGKETIYIIQVYYKLF